MFVGKHIIIYNSKMTRLGPLGESIACEYLRNNGFRILERNFRRYWGELDIVAQYKNGLLAFVEVKTINPSNSQGVSAEDELTPAKLKKLQRTAQLYVGEHPELIHDDGGWRIDLLCLTTKKSDPQRLSDFDIKHYENI